MYCGRRSRDLRRTIGQADRRYLSLRIKSFDNPKRGDKFPGGTATAESVRTTLVPPLCAYPFLLFLTLPPFLFYSPHFCLEAADLKVQPFLHLYALERYRHEP